MNASRDVIKYGYMIDSERKVIFQVFEGLFSLTRLIACVRRLWNDPAYSKNYPGIVDISHLTPSVGLDDLHGLVAFLKSDIHTSVGRWAVITSSPAATAGSMVYKRTMAGRHAFEVFSTWESAGDFLQLEITGRPDIPFLPDLSEPEPPPAPVI